MHPKKSTSSPRNPVMAGITAVLFSGLLVFSVGCEGDGDDAEDYVSANTITDSQQQTAFSDGSGEVSGDGTGSLSFTSDPSELEVAADGDVLVLSASGGAPPYSWSVLYPARGSVDPSGNSVVYTRNSAGDNVVTLSDAGGTTRKIHIRQP